MNLKIKSSICVFGMGSLMIFFQNFGPTDQQKLKAIEEKIVKAYALASEIRLKENEMLQNNQFRKREEFGVEYSQQLRQVAELILEREKILKSLQDPNVSNPSSPPTMPKPIGILKSPPSKALPFPQK